MSDLSTRLRFGEEPLQDVRHLGAVELLTPKPDESLWYFRDLLGMEVVHAAGESAWLRGYGDDAASTLKLTAADTSGVGCIWWRAASTAALVRRARAIEATGLGLGWAPPEFGRGESYRFMSPDGHPMAIYFEETRYQAPEALRSTLRNQPQKYTGRGVCVRRIDHLALMARDVALNREFAQRLLGFQLREQVRFDHGQTEIGSWLSPNPIHHQVAFVRDAGHSPGGRLHHFTMWVDNREDVLRAADILSENGIFIEAGPSKHNNSQGFYLYSYEPGGNRIEVFSGSFLVFSPDWQPVLWNEAQRGTGVYWGGALPQSFAEYATPPISAAPALANQAESVRIPVFDPY
jgi:catechol 2,3-dioxygenase